MLKPTLKTLGERLAWAREMRGLTQQELADRAGCSRDVIAKTENGTTRMTKGIDKIAHALEVSPAWLAFGRDEIDAWDKETLEMAQKISQMPDETRVAVKALIETLTKD